MIGNLKKNAVEAMIAVAVVGVVAGYLYSLVWNNRGATENRAYAGATEFIAKNSVQKKRITCAGDSDGDGYGTCTIATTDGEIITLQCPTDFVDVNVWHATSCKEIPVMRMQGFVGRQ